MAVAVARADEASEARRVDVGEVAADDSVARGVLAALAGETELGS